MKKLTFFFYLVFIQTLVSCAINGLTNDYGKLDESQKAFISPLKDFDSVENGRIYTLNATQLKQELQKHPKAIVYVFTNRCTSEYCLPINVYKSYAENNGYQLFLVMSGFGYLDETLDQMVETPYFSIDNEFYGVTLRSKYTNYFENELMNLAREFKHKEYLGNLFFFENGAFKSVHKELPKSI